jgi:hypothetical protein
MAYLLQDWTRNLPMHQQSALLMPIAGPIDQQMVNSITTVVRCYRGSLFNSPGYGRPLRNNEACGLCDMTIADILNTYAWQTTVRNFIRDIDGIPVIWFRLFLSGVKIMGYKHPADRLRERWNGLYLKCCELMHVLPENEEALDARMDDLGRKYWPTPVDASDIPY